MFDFTALGHLSTPAIIAHRGAVSFAHENTLEAFEAAVQIGADAIEFDVRRTSDGVLVIHHDATLPGKRRQVANATCEELKLSGARRGYHIPTLEETLHHLCGRIALDIELKEAGFEREVLDLVREFYPFRHAILKSFNETAVRRLKELAPDAMIGLLVGAHRVKSMLSSKRVLTIARVRRLNADFVSPHRVLVRLPFVRRMRLAGIPLVVWTVNDVRTARRLSRQGIAGIITNVPERFVADQSLRQRT
ncbi:MAG: glycerophosphodiester phosphodiesterase [Candidatus Zixiibacteriota bacterium]|jgi:glycerophosphoryl diester phosphodiesterase